MKYMVSSIKSVLLIVAVGAGVWLSNSASVSGRTFKAYGYHVNGVPWASYTSNRSYQSGVCRSPMYLKYGRFSVRSQITSPVVSGRPFLAQPQSTFPGFSEGLDTLDYEVLGSIKNHVEDLGG